MLLLLGNTPMDFIHLFADHVDTEHKAVERKGPVFEKKHHHCAFLSLSLESFVNDYSIPVILFTPPVYFTVRTALPEQSVQRCIVAVSLRGPPAA